MEKKIRTNHVTSRDVEQLCCCYPWVGGWGR